MNTDDERDFELPDNLSDEAAAQLICCLYEIARCLENRYFAQIRRHYTPTTMNSCRCGTKIRPSDPPVRNAKYMHHQKPPPAPVKRVSLAPLTTPSTHGYVVGNPE